MARFSYQDFVGELIETCFDYIRESHQQIHYYQASVYKSEIMFNIERKVEALRTICFLIGDEQIVEPLKDYDSLSVIDGNSIAVESNSFVARTLKLIRSLEEQLKIYQELVQNKQVFLPEHKISQAVRSSKKKLLSICRRGTRPWAMLQSL